MTAEISYYQQRMNLLGITDENNTVMLKYHDVKKNATALRPEPIFTETKKGIDILVWNVERQKIGYSKDDKTGRRVSSEPYKITRLEHPIIKKDGSEIKYLMPKGEPTVPFIPPSLLDKYDNKTHIKALYITEGYFKAFKAQLHGIDCIGVPSITCLKDRESGELHQDIKKIIERCTVERIVWLVDGDCRNLSRKEIENGSDLTKRPNQFYKTVATFYDLLSKYDHVNKYFAHINTDNIEGHPKGLDDLLCQLPAKAQDIAEEAQAFDKIQQSTYIGKYFIKMNITYGVGKVRQYFLLHDVDTFYLYYVEQRPELKGKDFRFFGTLYQYQEADGDRGGKCEIKVPSSAANYCRVGDNYYEFVQVPNKYSALSNQLHKRQKETIKEDNAKDIFKHIPKYKAFCNVPDHLNYQRVIANCFNTYSPFLHEPEEGDYTQTLDFIKHIFGTEIIEYKGENDEIQKIPSYELGLDYLTILYKKPQQILPILCLVSSERQTGKTTFAKWLNLIFTENMAIVGNQDLANNFNSHWASKLIICCDETKIDKQVVMERVKSLSTSHTIMKEGKGVDQLAMDFFGKFIFLTNNEENFITVDEEEIRFWIKKVPSIKKRVTDLELELMEEIPAFLHFLNSRQMITKNKERHWFDTKLLRTEALTKVVQNSKPSIQKLLRQRVAQIFADLEDTQTLYFPFQAIKDELIKKSGWDDSYIKRTLNEMGFKSQKVARKAFPRMTQVGDGNGGAKMDWVWIGFHSTYYQFERSDFADLIDTEHSENTEAETPGEAAHSDLPF